MLELSEIDERMARDLLEAGWMVKDVAEKLGVMYAALYHLARKKGWNTARKDPMKIDDERAGKLLEEGWTVRAVAKEMGVGFREFYHHARKRGWKTSLMGKKVGPREGSPPIDEAEAKKLLEEGWTVRAVADRLGATYSTLYHLGRERGWPTKPKMTAITPDQMMTVRELIDCGKGYTEIGEILGVHRISVLRACKKIGIKAQQHEPGSQYDGPILDLHRKGYKQVEIARELGIGQSYVSLRMRAMGIYRGEGGTHGTVDRDKVWELRAQGMSQMAIAEALGCSRGAIHNVLKTTRRHGLKDTIKFI